MFFFFFPLSKTPCGCFCAAGSGRLVRVNECSEIQGDPQGKLDTVCKKICNLREDLFSTNMLKPNVNNKTSIDAMERLPEG